MSPTIQDQLQEQRTQTRSPEALRALLEALPTEGGQTARGPLSFREIGHGYQPGRSLGLSVLIHQLALLLILISSSHFVFVRAAEVVQPRLEPLRLDDAIYLPVLGGGSEGSGRQGGGSGDDEKNSTGLRARSRQGFAYPGPQPLVSEPPRATLGIQTILQPMLKNPPLIKQYLPLPNLEQPAAEALPEPPKPVLKVKSGRLAIRTEAKPVQAPKVTLSAAASSSVPDLQAPDAVMPQAPPPPPVPASAETSDLPVESRSQQRGLLVLNAVPPPPDVSGKVPMVEARSRFAVAPGESTVIAAPAAGTRSGGSSSMAASNGSAADIASGDAIADVPSGGGSTRGAGGSGSGSGARYGSGKGSGLNASVEGAGAGRGTAAGAGSGAGPGATLGSGNGAGSSPSPGGFAGITVSGGRYGNGASGGIRPSVAPRGQASYEMTITSTASSGGGLQDFGVFQNEKVYTVYLDMRASEDDPSPRWILQYAVLQPPADPANGGLISRIVGTPTPPYAMLKQIPELSSELTAKCAHKLIVASAILNAEGKLERVSVRQTPDADVNPAVIEALRNWTFEPAKIDGQPVALKILFGIRLLAR